MADDIKLPSIDVANNANIEAILIANEKRIKELESSRTKSIVTVYASVGTAVGAAFAGVGAVIGAPLGTAIGSVVASVVNKILPKKQPWSALGNEDKGNLIQGLIYEAVWQKGLLNVEQVKSHILTTFVEHGILFKKDEEVNKFFPNNDWALARVVSEVKKGKDMENLMQMIHHAYLMETNGLKERQAIASSYQTFLKIKAGQKITKKEAEMFLLGQSSLKLIAVSKSIKGKR